VIIYLNSVKMFIFVMVKCCVFVAVRTKSVRVTWMGFNSGEFKETECKLPPVACESTVDQLHKMCQRTVICSVQHRPFHSNYVTAEFSVYIHTVHACNQTHD
jgi:hypothetical protein